MGASRFTLTFAGLTAGQMGALICAAERKHIPEPKVQHEALVGTVSISDVGPNKIQVIKAVREVTGMGLKEAKDIAEIEPRVVEIGCTPARAEEIRTALVAAGATVKVV